MPETKKSPLDDPALITLLKRQYYRARVDKQGRLLIPADLRKELEIGPGEPVTLWAEDGELRTITLRQAVKNIQAIAMKLKKPGESVVDEFLRERREEAARE